tara:strand:+ start:805 stop:1890 length:1086 start_codon:yes stop_codon:yes gene_type:complete
MAINVNTVYTTVLSILNKEQRGYLTPDEFNKIATQVQLEIFEKFFEDYNQYLRMPKTDVEFASRVDHIREEFQVFEEDSDGSYTGVDSTYKQPDNLHRFGSASYTKGLNSPLIEIVSSTEYKQQVLSPLTQPTKNFPIAKYSGDKLTVSPATETPVSSDIRFNYIRKPKDPRWGFTVGSLGQYIYDPNPLITFTGILKTNQDLFNTTVGVINNLVDCTVASGSSTIPNTSITSFIDIAPAGGTSATADFTCGPLIAGKGPLESFTITGGGTGFNIGDQIALGDGSNSFAGSSSGVTVFTLQESNFVPIIPSAGSVDFEISDSQQTEVILEVLKYAGVIVRDPSIVQVASQELAQEENNNKR